MWRLKSNRPLAVFDIESTGVNPRMDRIIDLAIVKVMPDGTRETHAYRVNPEKPIPAEVIAIHGIRDEDVKDCPTFGEIALAVAGQLEECDLAGYNLIHFDIPMLTEEFRRAGVPFALEGRRVIDAQRIFHRREPRDLTAALNFYCGESHDGAHGALEDVEATIRVIEGQLDRYTDLPDTIDGLDAFCNPRNPAWLDRTGKLKWKDGEAVINFGRNQGRLLRDLARTEAGFLRWILNSNFPQDTRDIVTDALDGKFPEAPPAGSSENSSDED